MDGVKLFPYCLERSTNVPKAALEAIECPELPEAAEAYRTSAAQLQAVGEEGIKTLEHAYSLCQNPDILKAKRKMMGHKTVTNGDKFAGNEYQAATAFGLVINVALQHLRDEVQESSRVLTFFPLVQDVNERQYDNKLLNNS